MNEDFLDLAKRLKELTEEEFKEEIDQVDYKNRTAAIPSGIVSHSACPGLMNRNHKD